MMMTNVFKRPGIFAMAAVAGFLSSACDSQIYDDLEPCNTNYHLKFRYDYNMKGEAFPKEVKSVHVWAFDNTGKLVWQHKESGTPNFGEDYRVNVPLEPGTYDFVTWCGLDSDSPFILDTENPSAPEDLGVTLSLSELTKADATSVSNVAMSGLYHDIKRGVQITHDPTKETDNEIGFSLTKDTNYVKVLLQNLDGTVMKEDDFTIYITSGNTRLEHDNAYGTGEEFEYHPWKVTAAEATLEGSKPEDGVITSVSSILAELHTSRLMADSNSLLVVHRNTDNTDIIRIPLVQYLLLVKGHYGPQGNMGDQEYLDRQDEYTLTFFIDKDSNWYRAIGIYINAWHVVPPQNGPLH